MSSIHGFVDQIDSTVSSYRGTNTCPDGRRRLDATAKPRQEHQPAQEDAALLEGYATSKWLRCRTHWSKSQDEKCTCRIACAPSFHALRRIRAYGCAEEGDKSRFEALKGMLAAIDQGAPNPCT